MKHFVPFAKLDPLIALKARVIHVLKRADALSSGW